MNHPLRHFTSSLTPGARLVVLLFALGFPIAWIGRETHSFDLYAWLALSPGAVWSGQVWRVITYGLIPLGPVDWAVSLFWLITLTLVVSRHWTSGGFIAYCVLALVAGALAIIVFLPGASWAGNAALIFALLAAWDWLYRNERILLLGIGEISVRQAVILVAVINSIIIGFCGGWKVLLAMLCGGAAGWLWLQVRAKFVLRQTAQQIRSERVARLEL